MWLGGRGRGEDEEEMLDDEVFENWDSGEPNRGGKHHCAMMRYNGKWSDCSCANKMAFLCEFPPPKKICRIL